MVLVPASPRDVSCECPKDIAMPTLMIGGTAQNASSTNVDWETLKMHLSVQEETLRKEKEKKREGKKEKKRNSGGRVMVEFHFLRLFFLLICTS